MNPNFEQYVKENRAIAEAQSVKWGLQVNCQGLISYGEAWNLTRMSGGSPPPTFWLRDLGTDSGAIEALSGVTANGPERVYKKQFLSIHWQDLIKASVIDQLLVCQTTPNHVLYNIVRPLRVLGTCMAREDPWTLTADDLGLAFDIAKKIQHSGKLADLIFGVVRSLLDSNHLTDNGPLSPTLTRTKRVDRRASKVARSISELRSTLETRKKAEKLPDRRAFWELVRIVFTEKPRTFVDILRFAQARTMLITGLRIGELALLPADWKRFKDFHDSRGHLAGESGGYSRSLMLRHFAEKQRNMNDFGMVLFESVQHIPPLFDEILTDTLDEVVRVTGPLRRTLKQQLESGRLLPWFKQCDSVRAVELYTYLTGNPIIVDLDDKIRERFKVQYKEHRDPNIFEEMRDIQLQAIDHGRLKEIGSGDLTFAALWYFRRLRAKGITPRKSDGTVWQGEAYWREIHINIGEIEQYYSKHVSSKLSDTAPLRLSNGELSAWELMFLMPKRSLSEARNDGFCDIARYCAIGRIDPALMINSLGGNGHETLFMTYGQTDEDRALTLNSHSLRHLQNTELFRLGVADAAITKRFNRRSVAQSYDYDHRSLAEELERIELSPGTENLLGEKATIVMKMIQAGKANGPIVNEFKRIQQEEGEKAALNFLSVEADGFHSTPYGHCLNSFYGGSVSEASGMLFWMPSPLCIRSTGKPPQSRAA